MAQKGWDDKQRQRKRRMVSEPDPREDRRGKSRHEVGTGGCGVMTGAGEHSPSLCGLELNAIKHLFSAADSSG